MIITNNIDFLKTKSIDVLPDEVNDLLSKLESELSHANKLGNNGVGLAAPQIGIHKKAAIIRVGNDFSINLINCNIEKKYDLALFKNEGCLSFPGKSVNTMRYQEIYVTNNLVYPHSFIISGFLAVVVQHELDHLNGIILHDNEIKTKKPKVGPNDPCICGSRIKYKKCCLRFK